MIYIFLGFSSHEHGRLELFENIPIFCLQMELILFSLKEVCVVSGDVTLILQFSFKTMH